MLLLAAFVGGKTWLNDHPQHDPAAPLTLDQPQGWATKGKLAALSGDPTQCRAFLERSDLAHSALEPEGAGACYRADRLALLGDDRLAALSPAAPVATCGVMAALARWQRQELQPIALETLGAEVARIEHYGTYSCRRIGGGETGRWSQHATGNAIDIAGFVLTDGRRISVERDWPGDDREAAFLRQVRDGACGSFAIVLSPDYNAAHADHLHLDQSAGAFGLCR